MQFYTPHSQLQEQKLKDQILMHVREVEAARVAKLSPSEYWGCMWPLCLLFHSVISVMKSLKVQLFWFSTEINRVSNNRVEYDIIRKKRKAKDKNVLSCAKSPISLLALTTQRLCSSLTSLTRRCCNPRFFHQIYWACMYKATISVRELTARIATAE